MLAHWAQTTQHSSQAVVGVKVDYRQGLQVLDLCLPGTSTFPGLTSAAGTDRCADSYLPPTTLLFPAETTEVRLRAPPNRAVQDSLSYNHYTADVQVLER